MLHIRRVKRRNFSLEPEAFLRSSDDAVDWKVSEVAWKKAKLVPGRRCLTPLRFFGKSEGEETVENLRR
jgi:hypothetical protein